MPYEVLVTEQPDRQMVAIYIFQRTPIERFVLQPPPGTFAWERLPEGGETPPTFAFGREVVARLAHQLAEHFHVDRSEQTERSRIAHLEGEQSGMRRHLDGLERLLRRVVTLVPEGPAVSVPGQLASTALNEPDGAVDAVYWRQRALSAEATIRETLGESPPAISVGGRTRPRAPDAESAVRDALVETAAPRPPRRILDVEPAPNIPLSRAIPGFAGEEAQ